MFGYIKPFVPELKMREHEEYKAVYCGLCAAMGRRCGRFAPLALSYDMVFLAMVRAAFTVGGEGHHEAFRCALKPKKRFRAAGDWLDYPACVGAVLAYHKCRDDLRDPGNIAKKFAARFVLPFLKRMARQAERHFPGLTALIAGPLEELHELERAPEPPTPDEAAECFALLLEGVAAYGIDSDAGQAAGRIGYNIGRWLYLIDALDDLERDRGNRSFNPFTAVYSDARAAAADIETLRAALTGSLREAAEAVNAHCSGKYFPIICNIINLGLPDAQERVFKKLTATEMP